jgi:hypothetical protein
MKDCTVSVEGRDGIAFAVKASTSLTVARQAAEQWTLGAANGYQRL